MGSTDRTPLAVPEVVTLADLDATIVDGVMDEWAESLAACRHVMAEYKEREAQLVELLADADEADGYVLADGRRIVKERKQSGGKTSWPDREVATKLRDYAAEHRQFLASSGEVESEGEAVTRVFLDCCRPGWRKTDLAKIPMGEHHSLADLAEVTSGQWRTEVTIR